MPRSIRLSLIALLALPAHAQWSDDPTQNTAVAVSPKKEDRARLAVAPDGSTWVAWYDQYLSGGQVRLQLLDQAGVGLFPPDGLLITNHTWWSDPAIPLDLIAGSDGSCVLVIHDLRSTTDLDVFAYRIDRAGDFLWGPDGVELSTSGDLEEEYEQRVVETSQGAFAFAWSSYPNTGTGSLRMQVLDASGAKQFGPNGITLDGDSNERPGKCELVATHDGGWILAWVRDVKIPGTHHLRAQRYAANGMPLWPVPVTASDGAPVHPNSMGPLLASDGSGGAVLAWYAWENDPIHKIAVRVHRLDPLGRELFPHDGVLASLEPTVIELYPALDFDEASGEPTVYYVRNNFTTTLAGLSAQRFSAVGARLWGDAGKILHPLDNLEEFDLVCVPFGDGACLFWMENNAPPATDSRLLAQRVDANGDPVWSPPTRLLAGNSEWKHRLAAGVDSSGMCVATWTSKWNEPDVLAQNVHPDGGLGLVSACNVSTYCIGAPNSVGAGARIGSSGGASLGLSSFTLEASGAPPGNIGIFYFGDGQAQVPFGDGFRCVGGTIARILPPDVISPAGTVAHLVDFELAPATLITVGSTWNFQFWYRDPAGPLGTSFNLSDALTATFCP